MFPDFKDLIALLNKHKIKYLVVGGYAVARHAQPRATKDDILIQPTRRNAVKVYAALVEFGAPLRTRSALDSHAAFRAKGRAQKAKVMTPIDAFLHQRTDNAPSLSTPAPWVGCS